MQHYNIGGVPLKKQRKLKRQMIAVTLLSYLVKQ